MFILLQIEFICKSIEFIWGFSARLDEAEIYCYAT